jgi:hypothetical protein
MKKSQGNFKKSITLGTNLSKQNTKVKESISNENLFYETEYKMKADLRFEAETDEQNGKKGIFLRNIEIIKFLMIYIIFSTFVFSMKADRISWTDSILNSFIYIFSSMSLIAIFNLNKFISNFLFIRLFSEFTSIIFMIATSSESEKNKVLFTRFAVCLILNYTSNLTISESFLFFFAEYIVYLFNFNTEQPFFLRFLFNIFSKDGVEAFIYMAAANIIQFFFSRAVRELWAMYDSFKRSFFILKKISDEAPYPVLILSMKKQNTNIGGVNTSYYYQYQIYYKNLEAEKLSQHIRLLRGGRDKMNKVMKADFNFKDLFEKTLEKLLEKELEKCTQCSIKYFDFPLIVGEANLTWKQSADHATLYEGDLENIHWVRIIVSPTIWKGVECLMIQIMENDDIRNNYFVQEYETLIKHEYFKIMNNNDSICSKAPDLKNQDNFRNSLPNNENVTTPELSRSPNTNCRTFLKSPLLLPTKNLYRSPQRPEMSDQTTPKKYDKLLNSVFSNSNNTKNTTDFNNQSFHLKASSEFETTNKSDFDYSLLFFQKSSLNYVYDMYLTVTTFNSLRVNKMQKTITQFNFEKLMRYLIIYLSPLLKQKNVKIDFNSESDGQIVAIYDYYRVIFVNIILFVLNNFRAQDYEAVLNINVSHVSFTDEGENVYEVTIDFQDFDPLIDYNKVAEMLSNFKLTEMKTSCIQKFKILDIGIVTSYFIITYVYNSEFKVSSKDGNNQISFLISNHGTQTDTEDKNLYKKFELEEKYYNKIMEKVYKTKRSPPINRPSNNQLSKRAGQDEDDRCKFFS